jgi:GNAT superfamily N-acetyltransferase
MEVRRARAEDAAQIAEVHVRSWQAAYHGLIPQDYLDGLDPAPSVEGRARQIREVDWARGGVLVAEDGTGLVGFANVCPTRDQDESPERVGEVAAIYLAPGAWGKGYGRQLMTMALEHLAGVGYQLATLWVLDTNMRAQRFYAAAGFRADGADMLDDRGTFQLRELRYRRPLP